MPSRITDITFPLHEDEIHWVYKLFSVINRADPKQKQIVDDDIKPAYDRIFDIIRSDGSVVMDWSIRKVGLEKVSADDTDLVILTISSSNCKPDVIAAFIQEIFKHLSLCYLISFTVTELNDERELTGRYGGIYRVSAEEITRVTPTIRRGISNS